jgi:hypothetical protein
MEISTVTEEINMEGPIKTTLPFDPVLPLLDIYTCVPIVIAALLTIISL